MFRPGTLPGGTKGLVGEAYSGQGSTRAHPLYYKSDAA